MATLDTRTAATAGQIKNSDLLYILKSDKSAEYKLSRTILLTGGTANPGEDITIIGGAGLSGNNNGGNIILLPGIKIGSGSNGNFIFRPANGTIGTDDLIVGGDGASSSYNRIGIALNSAKLGFFCNNSGLSGSTTLQITNQQVSLARFLAFMSSDANDDTANSAEIGRVTTGVLGGRDFNGVGFRTWIQNTAGASSVTTQFDKNDTTLAAIPGLASVLQAGRTYKFWVYLPITADVTGGYKVSMDTSDTLTATTIYYDISVITNGVTPSLSRKTSLSSSTTGTLGTTVGISIVGMITVNAAGTIVPKFAQSTANGTSSVLVGADMFVQDYPDSTPPTITSSSIDTTGRIVTVNFSEACNGHNGFTLATNVGTPTLTYSSGEGTSTFTYTTNRVIWSYETLTSGLIYTAGNIKNLDGISLLNVSKNVTNNSTQTGPTSFWKLSNNPNDFGSNGTMTLTPTGAGVTYGPGYAHFDGVDTLGKTGTVVSPAGDFTLTGWVYLDITGLFTWMANNTSSGGLETEWRNDGRWAVSCYNGSGFQSATLNSITQTTAVWNFCTITYTASTKILTIDHNNSGTPATVTLTGPATFGAVGWFLGKGFSGFSNLTGRIQCVGFWDGQVLGSTYLTTLYNSGVPYDPTS